MFHTKLITVCFSDRTRFICPGIPDSRTEIMYIVALCLPDPEEFVNGGFPEGSADGKNREFFRKIIAVDYTKTLYRVSRCAVFPTGAHGKICIPCPVIQNITAILNKYLISSAHIQPPENGFFIFYHERERMATVLWTRKGSRLTKRKGVFIMQAETNTESKNRKGEKQ